MPLCVISVRHVRVWCAISLCVYEVLAGNLSNVWAGHCCWHHVCMGGCKCCWHFVCMRVNAARTVHCVLFSSDCHSVHLAIFAEGSWTQRGPEVSHEGFTGVFSMGLRLTPSATILACCGVFCCDAILKLTDEKLTKSLSVIRAVNFYGMFTRLCICWDAQSLSTRQGADRKLWGRQSGVPDGCYGTLHMVCSRIFNPSTDTCGTSTPLV